MRPVTTEHRNNLITCLESFGDNWQAFYAMAEIAYWELHRELPEWAIFIERIERYPGGDLIIHRDRTAVD